MKRWWRSCLIPLLLLLLAAAAPLRALASPATGYWWNPASPGSGFVIEIQGSQMFMAGFLYAANGDATWVASSGSMESGTQYSGSLVTYSGGQTLNGSYQQATALPAQGTITINFISDTTAALSWQNASGSASFAIQRFDIVANGSSTPQPATNPQTGWWWNPAEGGRGFAIEVQGGQMYFAGYMYDATGAATWYLAIGAMADAALFQGELSQYGGGPTLAGPYKAPTIVNAMAGAISLQFSSTTSATLTLPDGRQIPLSRYTFGLTGPTLTAFSPAAAAPAGVLNLAGTNFDTTAQFSLTLSDNTGYSVSVPLTSVTATSATASVPPYFNTTTGVFGSGTVNLTLTQVSGGTSVSSNALTGFNIQKLPAAANAGQGTVSLIRATLLEAQTYENAVLQTGLASPAVDAAMTAEIDDVQQLLNNVESVVENGLSFTLGVVGGVNISVNQNNIADVDSLILASLQALAPAPGGTEDKTTEATTETTTLPCMSAEASAFAQAMISGNGNLDTLAQNLIKAPNSSAACNTVATFTPAYLIFGGAGGLGLGIADGAGGPATPPARLPGAALFAAVNGHAIVPMGMGALVSPALADQLPAVQFAIGGLTGLDLPLENELIAKSSGEFATGLSDAEALITKLAPPVLFVGGIVPTDLPNGTYDLTESFALTMFGRPVSGSVGPTVLTNIDGTAFAMLLQGDISAFNSARGCNNAGTTCSAAVTAFDGTTFQVVVTMTGPVTGGTITYLLTKTG